MGTTFKYEIYFETELTDDESDRFCQLMEEAVSDPKLLVWQATGPDFIIGFVEYSSSGMEKEEAVAYFKKQVRQLNYRLEIKNCG